MKYFGKIIIKNIHIADELNKKRGSKPAIGSGKINFQEIFDIIKKYNYNGALIVELAFAKDLPKSLDFVKKFFWIKKISLLHKPINK